MGTTNNFANTEWQLSGIINYPSHSCQDVETKEGVTIARVMFSQTDKYKTPINYAPFIKQSPKMYDALCLIVRLGLNEGRKYMAEKILADIEREMV